MKDLFDTAGVRSTYGSAVFADHVPAVTAAWVAELESRGWVNVGKTNLHEFAYGVTSQNLHYGVVPNPRVPALTAGGSSGGSAAALVLGLADAATRDGHGWVDPHSRRVLRRRRAQADVRPRADGRRVSARADVRPRGADGALRRRVRVAARARRCRRCVDDVRIACAWGGVRGEPIEFPTAEAVVPAFMREVGDVHRELYAESGELYGENIRGKVERCIAVSDAEYAVAVRARDELRERAEAALDGFDVLVTPVLSCPVPPVDCEEIEVRAAMTRYTFPFNALGWPALAVGNVQIVGRPGDDALVLAVGRSFE